jgi:hypothetical protein
LLDWYAYGKILQMSYLNTRLTKSASDDSYDFIRQNIAPSIAAAGLGVPQYLIGQQLLNAGPDSYEGAKDVLKGMQDVWDKLGVERVNNYKGAMAATPHYNPLTSAIHADVDNLGILAHETGHAMNDKTIKSLLGKPGFIAHKVLYGTGKLGMLAGGALSSLAALFGLEDDTVKNIGLTGTALSTPMIAEELMASARGARMLRKLKAPLKSRLGAFAGIPTYLLGAASPMAPWLGMKAYDKLTED